jgi:hypothetical protein
MFLFWQQLNKIIAPLNKGVGVGRPIGTPAHTAGVVVVSFHMAIPVIACL